MPYNALYHPPYGAKIYRKDDLTVGALISVCVMSLKLQKRFQNVYEIIILICISHWMDGLQMPQRSSTEAESCCVGGV